MSNLQRGEQLLAINKIRHGYHISLKVSESKFGAILGAITAALGALPPGPEATSSKSRTRGKRGARETREREVEAPVVSTKKRRKSTRPATKLASMEEAVVVCSNLPPPELSTELPPVEENVPEPPKELPPVSIVNESGDNDSPPDAQEALAEEIQLEAGNTEDLDSLASDPGKLIEALEEELSQLAQEKTLLVSKKMHDTWDRKCLRNKHLERHRDKCLSYFQRAATRGTVAVWEDRKNCVRCNDEFGALPEEYVDDTATRKREIADRYSAIVLEIHAQRQHVKNRQAAASAKLADRGSKIRANRPSTEGTRTDGVDQGSFEYTIRPDQLGHFARI
jgi:hypothetical protein